MDNDFTPIYILTWNPKKYLWRDYAYKVKFCKHKGRLLSSWSCRSKRPDKNDRFILLMQGMGDKNGVVGAGRFCEKPKDVGQDTRFGSRFADIDFGLLLNYRKEDYVKTALLQELFPEQCWTPQISGTKVKSKYTKKLWEMIVHK